jgi:hypothetical protein
MTFTTLRAQSEWLAKRKGELGISGYGYVAVNPGSRRTPAKRALLATLALIAGRSRRALGFRARY